MLAYKLDEVFPEVPAAPAGTAVNPLQAPQYEQWADAPINAPADTGQHAQALLELSQLADPEADPGDDAEAWHLPPPDIHTTGSQLRRRLVTPESIAELTAPTKRSLIQRILGRK